MKKIWAPWRFSYVIGGEREGCFLCAREELVVYEGKTCFIMLNAYPYNNGHLLIAPYRHIRELDDLSADEAGELHELTKRGVACLRKLYKPHGFNVGLNLGEAAGAGEEHFHLHVVPRWYGDTNFMPVLADVKIISEHLKQSQERISEEIRKI